jgi:chitinase
VATGSRGWDDHATMTHSSKKMVTLYHHVMIILSAIALSFSALASITYLQTPVGANQTPDKPSNKVVIGYVQDDDPDPAILDLVDYSKVTHLNVAFANPSDANGDLSVTPNLDRLVDRAHKQNVKVFVSMGGGDASENKSSRDLYFSLITDPNRAAFVAKLSKYLDDHNLDGLDVDLEGPAIGKDYGAFIGDLSKALKPKGKLLSAAVSGGYGGDQISADALNDFDFVNVMAYDATGPWDPAKSGQHSSFDYAKDCATYWLGRGVPKAKLVLGVPFYGYGFGDAFTKGGYMYSEIVAKFPGAELLDQVGKTIWYNGIPTIQAKTKYVLDQGLGGVMIWSLNQDAKGKLSLLAAIHEALTATSSR